MFDKNPWRISHKIGGYVILSCAVFALTACGAARKEGGPAAGSSLPNNSSSKSKLGVTPKASFKPRVIATTDGEIDDRSSMVRFLMYASEYDVAGIIQVNSNAQRSGHSDEKWIEEQIAAYKQQLPNLRVHHPDFPDAEALLKVLKVGNENSSDFGKSPAVIADSVGTQHIIKVLLDDDPRPVHILAWGGANTQASALWQIKQNYSAADYKKAAAKAVLYCIWFQDKAGDFIVKEFPEVKIYGAGRPERDGSWRDVWDYRSVDGKKGGDRDSANPKDIQVLMDDPWLKMNITTHHGPLGALYPQSWTSEGDTPSFMTLVDNGLRQDMDYTLGGWGGRAIYADGNYMEDGADDNNGKADMHYTFFRWLKAVQADWAARADWMVAANYEDANHQPDAQVVGDLVRAVSQGETITLDASPTTDPDGDGLTFKWWQYYEADSVKAKVLITNDHLQKGASFVIPNESGKQVQIILEVKDSGTPALTRYQRLLFNIK